ncbi:TPA: HNH endonuclease [Enterococcus faecalis]|nr:HNH endonuclease [Enterococcus faecalis]
MTEEEWETALAYFNYSCAYCGDSDEITKDHLDPLKKGGELTFSNVVPACRSCNSSKKDHQWLSWYQNQNFYDKYKANKITDYISFVLSLPKKEDRTELVVTKKVTKQVAPNPTAAIFWLKNRKPDEWRDRKETQISGEMSVSNPFTNLSEEELRRLAKDDG